MHEECSVVCWSASRVVEASCRWDLRNLNGLDAHVRVHRSPRFLIENRIMNLYMDCT